MSMMAYFIRLFSNSSFMVCAACRYWPTEIGLSCGHYMCRWCAMLRPQADGSVQSICVFCSAWHRKRVASFLVVIYDANQNQLFFVPPNAGSNLDFLQPYLCDARGGGPPLPTFPWLPIQAPPPYHHHHHAGALTHLPHQQQQQQQQQQIRDQHHHHAMPPEALAPPQPMGAYMAPIPQQLAPPRSSATAYSRTTRVEVSERGCHMPHPPGGSMPTMLPPEAPPLITGYPSAWNGPMMSGHVPTMKMDMPLQAAASLPPASQAAGRGSGGVRRSSEEHIGRAYREESNYYNYQRKVETLPTDLRQNRRADGKRYSPSTGRYQRNNNARKTPPNADRRSAEDNSEQRSDSSGIRSSPGKLEDFARFSNSSGYYSPYNPARGAPRLAPLALQPPPLLPQPQFLPSSYNMEFYNSSFGIDEPRSGDTYICTGGTSSGVENSSMLYEDISSYSSQNSTRDDAEEPLLSTSATDGHPVFAGETADEQNKQDEGVIDLSLNSRQRGANESSSTTLVEHPFATSDSNEAVIGHRPEVAVAEPEVGVAEPDVGVDEREVNVAAPEVGVTAPEVSVHAPELSVHAPEVGVSQPEVGVSQPEVPQVSNTFNLTAECELRDDELDDLVVTRTSTSTLKNNEEEEDREEPKTPPEPIKLPEISAPRSVDCYLCTMEARGELGSPPGTNRLATCGYMLTNPSTSGGSFERFLYRTRPARGDGSSVVQDGYLRAGTSSSYDERPPIPLSPIVTILEDGVAVRQSSEISGLFQEPDPESGEAASNFVRNTESYTILGEDGTNKQSLLPTVEDVATNERPSSTETDLDTSAVLYHNVRLLDNPNQYQFEPKEASSSKDVATNTSPPPPPATPLKPPIPPRKKSQIPSPIRPVSSPIKLDSEDERRILAAIPPPPRTSTPFSPVGKSPSKSRVLGKLLSSPGGGLKKVVRTLTRGAGGTLAHKPIGSTAVVSDGESASGHKRSGSVPDKTRSRSSPATNHRRCVNTVATAGIGANAMRVKPRTTSPVPIPAALQRGARPKTTTRVGGTSPPKSNGPQRRSASMDKAQHQSRKRSPVAETSTQVLQKSCTVSTNTSASNASSVCSLVPLGDVEKVVAQMLEKMTPKIDESTFGNVANRLARLLHEGSNEDDSLQWVCRNLPISTFVQLLNALQQASAFEASVDRLLHTIRDTYLAQLRGERPAGSNGNESAAVVVDEKLRELVEYILNFPGRDGSSDVSSDVSDGGSKNADEDASDAARREAVAALARSASPTPVGSTEFACCVSPSVEGGKGNGPSLTPPSPSSPSALSPNSSKSASLWKQTVNQCRQFRKISSKVRNLVGKDQHNSSRLSDHSSNNSAVLRLSSQDSVSSDRDNDVTLTADQQKWLRGRGAGNATNSSGNRTLRNTNSRSKDLSSSSDTATPPSSASKNSKRRKRRKRESPRKRVQHSRSQSETDSSEESVSHGPKEVIPPLRKRGFQYTEECMDVLNKMYNSKHSLHLRYDDEVEETSETVCLDHIAAKLRRREIVDIGHFVREVKRVFDNSRKTCQVGSTEYIDTLTLVGWFCELMSEKFPGYDMEILAK